MFEDYDDQSYDELDRDHDEEYLGEDRDYDDGMDGDHDSALASAGWGCDEDYVHDNDHFDDY